MRKKTIFKGTEIHQIPGGSIVRVLALDKRDAYLRGIDPIDELALAAQEGELSWFFETPVIHFPSGLKCADGSKRWENSKEGFVFLISKRLKIKLVK